MVKAFLKTCRKKFFNRKILKNNKAIREIMESQKARRANVVFKKNNSFHPDIGGTGILF